MTLFPALITPFPVNAFPNIEAPEVLNRKKKNRLLVFLFLVISCFPVLLLPSINTPEFYSDFMFLLKASLYLLEMVKVIPFPALETPRSHIFL